MAAGIALLIAGVVLVGAILPAEYGIDPTGVGGLLGLMELQEDQEPPPDDNRTPAQTLQEYQGTWPTTTTVLYAADVYVDAEGITIPINVSEPNLAMFQVIATWTDDDGTATQGTEPDLLEVSLQPPSDNAAPAVLARNDADGQGPLEAGRRVVATPPPATVIAASPDQAFFALQDLHPPDHKGTGEWDVLLRMEPGQTRIQGIEIPGSDDGNMVHVLVQATTFALDTNIATTQARLLERTFDFGPGQGMELKVYMDKGQSLEYTWNTSAGELYFDFHGDPAGGDGSDFVRHAEGQRPEDSGEFTAPFDGSHGWFWQNTLDEPVTVTLALRGAFVLL